MWTELYVKSLHGFSKYLQNLIYFLKVVSLHFFFIKKVKMFYTPNADAVTIRHSKVV